MPRPPIDPTVRALLPSINVEELMDVPNEYDVPVGPDSEVPPGPWDPRSDESTEAYHAFDIYRRMGPIKRTALKVAIILREEKRGVASVDGESASDVLYFQAGGAQESGSAADGQPSQDQRSYREQTPSRALKPIRQPPGYINKWCVEHEWPSRARSWDEWVYSQVRDREVQMRKQEVVERAHQERLIRAKFLKINLALLERVLDAIMSGASWSAKDLRDLTLSAERNGLVRAEAFKGVRDILEEDGRGEGELPIQVAARLQEAMAQVALESLGPAEEVIDVESTQVRPLL